MNVGVGGMEGEMDRHYRRDDGRMLMAMHWPVINDDASGRG